MPGIFAHTVTLGAVQTGIGLAEDAGTGLVDRLRTLPMSSSALLTGRTVSDLLRNIGTGDAETTQAVIFPVTFASSAFVPTTPMPLAAGLHRQPSP